MDGGALLLENKLAEAEPLFREVLAIDCAALPAGHADIALGLSNVSPDGSPDLARFLWRSGSALPENKDAAAAMPELEEAVAMGEKVLPADHPLINEYRETPA